MLSGGLETKFVSHSGFEINKRPQGIILFKYNNIIRHNLNNKKNIETEK